MTAEQIIELTWPTLKAPDKFPEVNTKLKEIIEAWEEFLQSPLGHYKKLLQRIKEYCQAAAENRLYGHITIATALLVTVNQFLTENL